MLPHTAADAAMEAAAVQLLRVPQRAVRANRVFHAELTGLGFAARGRGPQQLRELLEVLGGGVDGGSRSCGGGVGGGGGAGLGMTHEQVGRGRTHMDTRTALKLALLVRLSKLLLAARMCMVVVGCALIPRDL